MEADSSQGLFPAHSGGYSFDPARLIQRRPAEGEVNVVDAQTSYHHERAHWFQFCGSTVGSAVLTLFRAEDTALLESFKGGAIPPADLALARQRLSAGLPLLGPPENEVAESGAGLKNLDSWLTNARNARCLLLEESSRWPSQHDLQGVLLTALLQIDQTYARHTGGSRSWSRGDVTVLPEALGSIHPCGPPGSEFTTRHVFESSALLNELGGVLATAWGADAQFEGLPRQHSWYVADKLAEASPLYTACLSHGVTRWASRDSALQQLEEPDRLAMSYPSLACCLDLAMNPAIGPISHCEVNDWEEVSVACRFMTAVEAVLEVGLLEKWPTNVLYAEYRSAVCDEAGLRLGALDHRSAQHPRFDGEFFCTVEIDDPLLPATKYFDYLIWAMEAMHEFRASFPLTWAMPWLLYHRDDGGPAPLHSLLDPDKVWTHAPIYVEGQELGYENRLSEGVFGSVLLHDLMQMHVMRQLPTAAGQLSLSGFPGEITTLDETRNELLDFATELTECEALRAWNIDPGVEAIEQHATDDEFKPAPRRVPIERQVRIEINRSDVEQMELRETVHSLQALRADPMANRFSTYFTFVGFDGSSKGIWDFPQVRNFFGAVSDQCGYWPWYVSVASGAEGLLGLLLFFVSRLESPRRFDVSDQRAFLIDSFTGLNSEAARVGVGEEDLKPMSLDLADAVQELGAVRLG